METDTGYEYLTIPPAIMNSFEALAGDERYKNYYIFKRKEVSSAQKLESKFGGSVGICTRKWMNTICIYSVYKAAGSELG